MSDLNLIQREYAEAVKHIKEEWLSTSDGKWYDHIVQLPSSERITYMLVVLQKQVLNGGFHQYFSNGYGQFAKETIPVLKKIGANKKAELLETALKKVNVKDDPDEVFRKQLLEFAIDPLFKTDELAAGLGVLDDSYYENEEEESLMELLEKYLESMNT